MRRVALTAGSVHLIELQKVRFNIFYKVLDKEHEEMR